MKKALSIILCLCIVLSVFAIVPFSATAAENEITETGATSGTTGDCRWSLNGTELTISGNGKMANYSYNSTLPWGKSITKVTITDGVTSIGEWAFYDCTSLTSITIPDSVTSIGDYAFYECSRLTSLTIPDSVTSIGLEAFYGCSSLTNITVSENNAVYDCRNNCNAIIETKTNTLLFGCMNTVIPNSVTNIGYHAFDGCNSLTSVTIPDSVTSIGYSAFSGCSSLTSVTIPDSVTSIGSSSFEDCTSLISVTIPDSVTSIGYYAFRGCSSLTSVTIPDSVTSISSSAFSHCSRLTSITIPDSVTSIGYDAFYDCEDLTSVTIPDSVTSIGEKAFGYTYYNNNRDKLIDGFVIYGLKNSAAENYANSNNITFKDILGFCSHCGIALTNEKLITDKSVPAACTSTGLTKGTHCRNCGTVFQAQEIIPATGHSPVTDKAVPAACTEDGLTEGSHCAACGIVLTAQEVIPKTGHKPIVDKAVEATCQHTGHTVGSHCENCGEVFVESKIIPQLPHTPVTDAAVTATCTRTGLTEGSHCSVCGDTIIEQKTIAMLPHTAGEMVIENDVPVTCTTSGSHDEVVYCTVCKNEISRNTITTKALGHNYEIVSGKPATYLRPGTEDGVRCTRCGEWLLQQEKYPVLTGKGIFWDVDSDGEVTALDATYILRNVASIEIPFVMDEAMGDADGDNLLTVMDATAIQRYLASLKSFFGIGITLPNENTDRNLVSSIDLSDDNATIIRGQKVQISAAVSPENADSKDLLWTSSDPSVATVDHSGKVTAIKYGTATIYATATDGSGVKGSCTITVEGIKVSSITLSSSTLNISKGQSKTLTATIVPSNADNKSLQWSSSDTSVATVDQNGKVTAVKGGTATIYATATDGSGTKGSCAVSVEEINVSDITLSPVSLTLTKGQSKTLSATVSPSNAQNKTLQWFTDNHTIASVDQSGKVTALKAGTTYITAVATDGSDKRCSCPVLVSDPNSGNAQLEAYNKLVHYIRTNPTGIYDYGDPYLFEYEDYGQNGYQAYSITATPWGGLEFHHEYETTKSGLTSTASVSFETIFYNNYTIEPHISFNVKDSISHHYINGFSAEATIDARNYSKNTTLSFSGLSYDDNKTANTAIQLAFTSWQLMLMTKCSTSMKDIGFSSFTLR